MNGNPPSRDAARIPDEFFYPPERVEELFRQRQMVLKNFRRLAEGDPGISLVTCHQLLDAVVYEPKIKLARGEVVEAAKFLCKHIRRGVPEYVTVGRRHLTLAETYHVLLLSLETFHHEGRLPEEVEAEWGLLGPVEIPIEWKPHGVRSGVEGVTPSVEQLAECASRVAEEIRGAKYPAVPVHTIGPWGQTPLNAAEMLWAMARAVAMIEDGKRGEIGLRHVSLYPEAVHWSSNPWLDDRHLQMFSRYHQLTALQLWTLKPAVLRGDCG